MQNLPKVSVFIATSLDGYIARIDGKLDWLDKANSSLPVGEDCGYKIFFDSVDTIVMGRKTFETVLSFNFWPYEGKNVVVLSSQLKDVPEALKSKIRVLSSTPIELLNLLSQNGAQHVYLDGGHTIQGFLEHELVDEMTITIIPVLLGKGISLFGPLSGDLSLTHLRTQTFPNGFVQTQYRVKKENL